MCERGVEGLCKQPARVGKHKVLHNTITLTHSIINLTDCFHLSVIVEVKYYSLNCVQQPPDNVGNV